MDTQAEETKKNNTNGPPVRKKPKQKSSIVSITVFSEWYHRAVID